MVTSKFAFLFFSANITFMSSLSDSKVWRVCTGSHSLLWLITWEESKGKSYRYAALNTVRPSLVALSVKASGTGEQTNWLHPGVNNHVMRPNIFCRETKSTWESHSCQWDASGLEKLTQSVQELCSAWTHALWTGEKGNTGVLSTDLHTLWGK